jgi:hypothetical protein
LRHYIAIGREICQCGTVRRQTNVRDAAYCGGYQRPPRLSDSWRHRHRAHRVPKTARSSEARRWTAAFFSPRPIFLLGAFEGINISALCNAKNIIIISSLWCLALENAFYMSEAGGRSFSAGRLARIRFATQYTGDCGRGFCDLVGV